MTLESKIGYNSIILGVFNNLGGSASQALLHHLDVGYGICIISGAPEVPIQDLEDALVQLLGAGGRMLMEEIRKQLDAVAIE